mgnify:CR=1 FL=1
MSQTAATLSWWQRLRRWWAEFTLQTKLLAAATSKVMDEITALLEDLRNEKAPAVRWDPSENNQSETGKF